MKIKYIEAATIEDARQQISELPARTYWAGDQVVVTYPDGRQEVFVFRNVVESKNSYVIRPGDNSVS